MEKTAIFVVVCFFFLSSSTFHERYCWCLQLLGISPEKCTQTKMPKKSKKKWLKKIKIKQKGYNKKKMFLFLHKKDIISLVEAHGYNISTDSYTTPCESSTYKEYSKYLTNNEIG